MESGAPDMKFIHEKNRMAGMVVPLLALRKNKTAACGVFSELVSLGKTAKHWGLSLIQLLPLNDTGNGTSPYSALSAFALHPIYISLAEVADTMISLGLPLLENDAKELVRADGAINRKFGQCARVSFEDVLQEKLAALRAAWRSNKDICAPLAETFAAKERWAKSYACFIALKEKFGLSPWWNWKQWKTASAADIDALWLNIEFSEEARFRLWLQVLAREQLQKAAGEVRGLGIDIMGDIPILLARDSADVWFHRDIFILDKQAGAPPDMYSPRGQNWGFPLYDWDALRASDYAFWRERLRYADQFYTSYRIDHVLGFFRIWSIDEFESEAYLGAFEPCERMRRSELHDFGFSDERIRWLSRPHVPEWKIQSAEKKCLDAFVAEMKYDDTPDLSVPGAVDVANRKESFARRLADLRASCFARINSEPLFLFHEGIRGTADIYSAFAAVKRDFPEARPSLNEYARSMSDWWIDRAIYEVQPDQFVFQWSYHDTTSWKSLSAQEQGTLEARLASLTAFSLTIWEKRGRELLSMLIAATGMQPFAEDLGAVPPCVPKVLREMEIPGLRVLRWEREWDKPNQPYIPLERYEPLSVACTSVHDSTNLRQWWAEEADRSQLWEMVGTMAKRDAMLRSLLDRYAHERVEEGEPAQTVSAPPKTLDTTASAILIRAVALSSSVMVVYPVQDILACHPEWRERDCRNERINVPGTMQPTNWTYRMPIDIHDLEKNKDFSAFVSQLVIRNMPDGER